jgi:hypothetical protein
VPLIVYATHAEAVEALHELFNSKKVSANAKMKEVLELCQDDPRWDSLKILSQGDKKQGLAEYQVFPSTTLGLLYVILKIVPYIIDEEAEARKRHSKAKGS